MLVPSEWSGGLVLQTVEVIEYRQSILKNILKFIRLSSVDKALCIVIILEADSSVCFSPCILWGMGMHQSHMEDLLKSVSNSGGVGWDQASVFLSSSRALLLFGDHTLRTAALEPMSRVWKGKRESHFIRFWAYPSVTRCFQDTKDPSLLHESGGKVDTLKSRTRGQS